MNNIEILERLEEMKQTFREEGLQGYEMTIVTAQNLINSLIKENKELKEKYEFAIEGGLDDKYEEVLEKTIKKHIDNGFIPKSKLNDLIRDYSVPKRNNERTMPWKQVEPFLQKLEELING